MTRGLADFIVDFGVLPHPLTYEEYIGLQMNASRARLRRAYYQGLAFSHANGIEEMPMALAEAACETKQQAKELAFAIGSDRAKREAGFK